MRINKIDKRVKCYDDFIKYYLPKYYKEQQEAEKEQERRNKLLYNREKNNTVKAI